MSLNGPEWDLIEQRLDSDPRRYGMPERGREKSLGLGSFNIRAIADLWPWLLAARRAIGIYRWLRSTRIVCSAAPASVESPVPARIAAVADLPAVVSVPSGGPPLGRLSGYGPSPDSR